MADILENHTDLIVTVRHREFSNPFLALEFNHQQRFLAGFLLLFQCEVFRTSSHGARGVMWRMKNVVSEACFPRDEESFTRFPIKVGHLIRVHHPDSDPRSELCAAPRIRRRADSPRRIRRRPPPWIFRDAPPRRRAAFHTEAVRPELELNSSRKGASNKAAEAETVIAKLFGRCAFTCREDA